MSDKHTPGPWACADGAMRGAFTVYLPSDGMVICSRNPYEDKGGEFSANARLIAAAPELLEAVTLLSAALERICLGHEMPADVVDDGLICAVNAAIAKATGA